MCSCSLEGGEWLGGCGSRIGLLRGGLRCFWCGVNVEERREREGKYEMLARMQVCGKESVESWPLTMPGQDMVCNFSDMGYGLRGEVV